MNILGMTFEELQEYMKKLMQPDFRAEQVFAWLHKGMSPQEMSNIPNDLRELLAKNYSASKTMDASLILSQNAVKFLNQVSDGNVVESVLMKYKYGNTLCVSTQAGCRMNCAICASGLTGLQRNLTAAEMVSQVINVNKSLGTGGEEHFRVTRNIVMMGSGEPLDNYDEVVQFIRIITHEKGINFSARNISVSTCGLADRIIDLAGEGLPVTLCVSLHSPIDRVRKIIMPITKKYPVKELIDAIKIYIEQTGRRVIIQYTLIDGLNDSLEQAKELVDLLKGLQCHVNIIRYNHIEELPWEASPQKNIDAFVKGLAPLSVSVRRKLASDIDGACGQLRLKHMQENGQPDAEEDDEGEAFEYYG